MLLFRDEEHAANWRRTKGVAQDGTMSLETGWRLAQLWYADKREPGWRRRTLEEAEAVFAELGLIDDFWRLRPAT
ncbi:MAG: hypothetical protein C0506_15395 [Anaerolinea sp.]|nr:hypothetical protein [Anaerolinea sp.]